MTTATRYIVSDLIANCKLIIGDGYRAKNSELSITGIPFARAGNISGGFNFADVDRFPIEDLHKVGIKISRPGDVVFTSKGTVGRFAYVNEDTPQFVYSPQLCFWRSTDESLIDSRYLFYWMQGHEFYGQYSGVASQTDMADYVSLRDQRRMHITLPSIDTQRSIAHILGTLDDKIELNRQMNRTLDEIVRTLFTSWFVNFDPVRAKAEGRQPEGMDAETAALFPDRFVDSELGPIPEGWEVSTIGNQVKVVGGSTPSTKNADYWEDGIHLWATPKDLSGLDSPILIDTSRKITDAGVQQITSRQLPIGTVLLSSRAPVGYLALTTEPTSINQGFIAMICDQSLTNYYVLNWARESMEIIKGNAGGTTFAEISKRAFRPIRLVVPSKSVIAQFTELVTPFYGRIECNVRESETLAVLRDTLLPELLSGRVRVPVAETVVSKAT